MNNEWTCNYTNGATTTPSGTYPVLTSSNCFITASSTATQPFTYYDWLFTNVVIIGIIGFIGVGLFFSIFKLK